MRPTGPQSEMTPGYAHYTPEDLNKPQANCYNQQQDFLKGNTANFLNDFRKTRLCANLQNCTKGDKCNFAHSVEELKMKPNLVKTKLCPSIQKIGHCPHGESCKYAHNELELRATPNIYKTSLCNNYMMGQCKLGLHCRFAHGEGELRRPFVATMIHTNKFQNNNNFVNKADDKKKMKVKAKPNQKKPINSPNQIPNNFNNGRNNYLDQQNYNQHNQAQKNANE